MSFVAGHDAPATLSIRPNPSDGLVIIPQEQVHPGGAVVEVINMHGRTEMRMATGQGSGSNEIPVDLRGLAPGIYILRIVAGNTIMTGKVILR